MHINAQSMVALTRKVVRVWSESDQHVAITISITTSITLSAVFGAIEMKVLLVVWTGGVWGDVGGLERMLDL